MAEKLAWGYDDIERSPSEALRLFKQAADLGFTDALIRIGQLKERGEGTARDLQGAVASYASAARQGNFLACAFLAKLLGRASRVKEAGQLWERFLAELELKPFNSFVAAEPGELLHWYIAAHLQANTEPLHVETLWRYRLEIAAYHQRVIESSSEVRPSNFDRTFKWIVANLGPWPA